MPFLNVLNRYSAPVEVQYDAAFNPDSPYRWEPGEVKVLPQDAAMFCRRKSVVRENPITGEQFRALLVQGIDKEYETSIVKVQEGSLAPPRGPELLDRQDMDASARAVTFVSLKNPEMTPLDREFVAVDSHARRVP